MAVSKVFKIELTGTGDVNKNIQTIRKAFTEMGKAVQTTKNELNLLLNVKGDSTQIRDLTAKLEQLNKSYEALRAQKKQAETDARREKDIAKELSAQKIQEAKEREAIARALKAEESARKAKIQTDQQEERQARRNKSSQDALTGSYNATYQAYRQLYNLVKSTPKGQAITFEGQLIGFDQAIAKLKQLAAAEQTFRRQFSRDGLLVGEYTSGIVQAFKELNIDDILRRQVTGAKEQLTELKKKNDELIVAFRKAQTEGSADFNKLEKEIHDNVLEMQSLKSAVSQADASLKGVGGIGGQITAGINNGVKQLKSSIAQFALTYFGFQALFSAVQSGVGNAKELSDQTSDLEINLNKAAGGADALVEQLAKLQTRTKLTVLEDIANTALRAGVAENNLLGVTKAIDIIKTAFGKDFGDIETGTETLVKLINIFFEDGEVTEDRILKIGNSIRKLANETVASVPFITDFAGRMAGVRQIANVSLPDIIGLGAGFEEFKQSAEVASTVLVKIIPKMANDLTTFAKIAGVTNEEFKTLLQDTPIEALLKVSEGLVAGKGDIEVFAEALKDAGLDAGRATTIISTLGGKADVFRTRIALAGKSINETGAITEAFNRKNNNLAATLDKISKKFADTANSKAFQTTITAISAAVLLLLNNIPALLTVLGLLSVTWAVQNAQLLLLRGQILLYNLTIGASYVALGLLSVAQAAYNVVLFVTNGALTIVTRALQIFGITLRATSGPLGVILTLAGLLASAYYAFGKSLAASTATLSDYAKQQRALRDITREASQQIANETGELRKWFKVATDSNVALSVRKEFIQKLIDKFPEYFGNLNKETASINDLTEAYGRAEAAIRKKAFAQASSDLAAKKQADVNEVAALELQLEDSAVGAGLIKELKGISPGVIDALFKNLDLAKTSLRKSGDDSIVFLEKDLQFVRKRLASVREQREKVVKIYDDLADKFNKEQLPPLKPPVVTIVDANKAEVDIEKLKNEIKKLDEQIDKFKGSQKELNKLIADRKKLQADLDKALGTEKSTKGSRLTGDQKDLFKEIEAVRDAQLLVNRKKFLELTIDEQTFLKNELKINTEANDKKIKLLKGATAEEKRIIAELNLQKIIDQQETNKKLFALINKQRESALEAAKRQQFQLIEDIDADPTLGEQEKIKLKQQVFDTLLLMQIDFNRKQIQLEKELGIISVEEADKRAKAIEEITKRSLQNERNTPAAILKDIQAAGEAAIALIKQDVAQKTAVILSSNDSYFEKARKIQALQREETERLLESEVDTLRKSKDAADELLKQKQISQQQYNDIITNLKIKEAALIEVTTDKEVTSLRRFVKALKELKDQFIETFLGIKRYSKDAIGEQQRVADAVTLTQSTIKEAISTAYKDFFDNENERVDREKENQLDSLEREKERVLARADSEAEKSTIERQYDQKRREVEKKASEEKKKLALKQLTIDFAVALIKTFAQFGFPLGLIPAAGLTFLYGVQRAQINQQKFARGGKVQPERNPLPAGKIFMRPNISTQPNGDNVLATVRTGEVILNEEHQRRAGGPAFFKKLGVPGFASSGLVTAPQLGTSLRPPVFTSNNVNSTVNNSTVQNAQDFRELKGMISDLASIVYSTDSKEVKLVTGKVTKAQKRNDRDVRLASI